MISVKYIYIYIGVEELFLSSSTYMESVVNVNIYGQIPSCKL